MGERLSAVPRVPLEGSSSLSAARWGIVTVRSFYRRHKVLKSGTGQFSLASLKRLATKPVVCLNGSPIPPEQKQSLKIQTEVEIIVWV